jgi:aminopeptidase
MDVQPGERVMIDGSSIPDEMAIALMRAVRRRGGRPTVRISAAKLKRELLIDGDEEDFQLAGELELAAIEKVQCYVAIRGSSNVYELSDVPPLRQRLYGEKMKAAHDYRVNKCKWVVLIWPCESAAQLARMSTEAFSDFFFRVCTFDYGRFCPGMEALRERMDRCCRVRVVSPGTNLSFSVEGMCAVPCGGKCNIPDGEVFTAPQKESVEGTIAYNVPSMQRGICFENVSFKFKKGRIVEATANDSATLNAILDSDDGARYIGEFSLGLNPHILTPICDTLFDEKISGSLHFTPGQAYEGIADNGNRSQIHWDLVLIQRPEFGGGEVYFDDELIRRDGIFLPDDLRQLNPDQLLKQE